MTVRLNFLGLKQASLVGVAYPITGKEIQFRGLEFKSKNGLQKINRLAPTTHSSEIGNDRLKTSDTFMTHEKRNADQCVAVGRVPHRNY